MTTTLVPSDAADVLERVIVGGDLARLSPADRVAYYRAVCQSVGLNPLTRPFDYITLNGRLTLYATKTATDQLRSIKGISIDGAKRDMSDDDYATWLVTGRDVSGRTDTEIGSVSIKGLSGENLANAIMKAMTKAKRRLTLSLAGLGWLDETEVGSIPSAQHADVDADTGEVRDRPSLAETVALRRERLAAPVPETPRPTAATVEGEATAGEDVPASPAIVQCDSVDDTLGPPEQCRREAGHKGHHRTAERSWSQPPRAPVDA